MRGWWRDCKVWYWSLIASFVARFDLMPWFVPRGRESCRSPNADAARLCRAWQQTGASGGVGDLCLVLRAEHGRASLLAREARRRITWVAYCAFWCGWSLLGLLLWPSWWAVLHVGLLLIQVPLLSINAYALRQCLWSSKEAARLAERLEFAVLLTEIERTGVPLVSVIRLGMDESVVEFELGGNE
jgi:hypothetical protein